MPYLFATDRPDYSDLASGRVFYSLSGHPAFPIRLASEIFQRCLAVRKTDNLGGRCVLYDPCCGAGYLLSLLGYLHRAEIQALIGSDIDAEAVTLAERNLGLLHADGLNRREAEIVEMIHQYDKESHHQALQSWGVISTQVRQALESCPLTTRTFQANVFDKNALREQFQETQVDIVLTDVPYGLHSAWQGAPQNGGALWALLDSLQALLRPGGLVAIAADKQQKINHEHYQRVERFQVGKRRIVILKLAS